MRLRVTRVTHVRCSSERGNEEADKQSSKIHKRFLRPILGRHVSHVVAPARTVKQTGGRDISCKQAGNRDYATRTQHENIFGKGHFWNEKEGEGGRGGGKEREERWREGEKGKEDTHTHTHTRTHAHTHTHTHFCTCLAWCRTSVARVAPPATPTMALMKLAMHIRTKNRSENSGDNSSTNMLRSFRTSAT